MTEEEKYQEIVNSRKASEEKKPEDTKPKDEPSGVKTDPPAEKQPEPEKKPDENKPDEGGKQPEDDKGKGPAKPSKPEQEEHALAAMRIKFKRENEALKKEIEELKKAQSANAPKPAAKTRKDFENDEAYEKHVRDSLKEEIRAEIMNEVNAQKAKQDESENFTAQLRGDLEKTFSKEVADKVFKDLNNPDSMMSEIILDERAKPIVEAVQSSERRADLLALMQAKPQIFQALLELPARKQEFRIYQLEDQIEAQYAKLKAKQAEDKQKQERAESLPSTGTFGVNGNGNDGINGLSTAERVRRYREEILKQRTNH